MQSHLVVFGSINLDLVATTPRLPAPGETLQGSSFFTCPGGKGANQAVAAGRLGAITYMVGRVGADAFGQELITALAEGGVNTEDVQIDPATHSGVALITVESHGENQIIVVPGANGRVNADDLARLKQRLPQAKALLLQLEIPLPMVELAAKTACESGVLVILDPAPAPLEFPSDLYSLIDVITPNEVEASQLLGFPVTNPETAQIAAQEFRQRGVKTAIVKLGDQGVVCATPTETFYIPAFPVVAVDTVAAGDAFNGALAVALSEGKTWREAVIWGAGAGALCATQVGAQSSVPGRSELMAFLMEHS